MKIVKLFAPKKFEGLDEVKLSIIVHLALLLALSAFFAWNSVKAESNVRKVVPVKLVSQVKTPGNETRKVTEKVVAKKASKGKRKSVSRKKSKSKTTKTVKKVAKKPAVKKVVKAPEKVVSKKPVKQVQKKVEAVAKAPVVEEVKKVLPKEAPVNNGVSDKPAVVQAKPEVVANPKPSHVNPTFENINQYSSANPFSGDPEFELTDADMPGAADELMPSDFLEMEEKSMEQASIAPANIGIKEARESEDTGEFKIGSIESFGGNSENFSPPGIISKKLPEYPVWARKNGVRGLAVYRVLIQQSGTVGDVVTMNSTIDPKLAINGAQALRRWVFTPVLVDGEPKETWVKITVQYQLNS